MVNEVEKIFLKWNVRVIEGLPKTETITIKKWWQEYVSIIFIYITVNIIFPFCNVSFPCLFIPLSCSIKLILNLYLCSCWHFCLRFLHCSWLWYETSTSLCNCWNFWGTFIFNFLTCNKTGLIIWIALYALSRWLEG